MSQEIQRRGTQDDARAVIEKPVLAILRKNKAVIETIAKGVLTEDRVFRLINAAITQTPALLECSPLSVLNAIVHATYLGIEIGPEQGYLVPFNDRKSGKKVCTLLIDYRAKIRIGANADIVVDDPEIVYAKDKFRRWTDENGKHFLHEPLEIGDRGEPVGAYVVCRWQGIAKITYMTAAEIEEIRKKSRNGESGPWKEWPMRQWCKTTVHRAFKTLPRPTNPDHAAKVQKAQEIDDKFDMAEPLDAIVEGDFEDEKPFLPAGSTEAQEKVVEEKLAKMSEQSVDSLPKKSVTQVLSENRDVMTPEENRALDEKLAREEREAERKREAEQQQPVVSQPKAKLQFGAKK